MWTQTKKLNVLYVLKKWRCRSLQTEPFFGLTKETFLEEVWVTMMTYSVSFQEAYSLPVDVRKWLLRRHNKYFKKKKSQESDDQPLNVSERLKYKNINKNIPRSSSVPKPPTQTYLHSLDVLPLTGYPSIRAFSFCLGVSQ